MKFSALLFCTGLIASVIAGPVPNGRRDGEIVGYFNSKSYHEEEAGKAKRDGEMVGYIDSKSYREEDAAKLKKDTEMVG